MGKQNCQWYQAMTRNTKIIAYVLVGCILAPVAYVIGILIWFVIGPSFYTLPKIADVPRLVSDCRELAKKWVEDGEESWMAHEEGIWDATFEKLLDMDTPASMPATILELSPQIVKLQDSNEVLAIDIQVTGGFNHAGYLVICEIRDPNYVPLMGGGGGWRTTRVAEDIYSYKE